MANIKSAQKAIRVTKRRTKINARVKESYREVKRQINRSLAKHEVTEAQGLLPKFQSEIDKAVKKGVIKKNTGARYKSRLVNLIKKEKNK